METVKTGKLATSQKAFSSYYVFIFLFLTSENQQFAAICWHPAINLVAAEQPAGRLI